LPPDISENESPAVIVEGEDVEEVTADLSPIASRLTSAAQLARRDHGQLAGTLNRSASSSCNRSSARTRSVMARWSWPSCPEPCQRLRGGYGDRVILPDETLAMLFQGYAFLPDRRRAHGRDAFTTRLLGRRATAVCGPMLGRAFYDPALFERSTA
jgi:hypothetical protein